MPTKTFLKEALSTFNLRIFKKWVKENDPLFWKTFAKYDAKTQKAIMARMICNRTDLLGTESHKKALRYLQENNTRGGIF